MDSYGTIAYVSQTAWIQTGTIRDNIPFGNVMDEHRYRQAIRKSSLDKDFELLPDGDHTEIGERGVNLSGGQNLEAFLVEVSELYASQPEIQLMRFAYYFGRALSGVSSVQFPWVKMFKESPLSKLIDVPLAHIPEPVYKTSVDWINQQPIDALGSFVLCAFDCILTDLAAQQGGAKGGKKGAQPTTSKSQEYEGRRLKVDYAKTKKKKTYAPREKPSPVPTFNLFVANLAFEAMAKHLKEFFDADTGNVVSTEVIFHENPRRSSGYGFVSFKTKER